MQLAEAIQRNTRGEPVSLLINPGNWGDALIRFGTERFLDYFGIRYRLLRLDGAPMNRMRLYRAGISGGVLLCSGGGAWCGHYNHLARTVETIRKRWRFRKIIVLPSTYDRHYEIPGVMFFRRDNMESAEVMPDSEFCHDMAFFIGRLQSARPKLERVHCFRGDVESSGRHQIPDDNIDLSARGNESSEVHPFFEYLAHYREIHTDRLHVAVGASLLGRDVCIYPGGYFKNKAMFLSSIQPYFKHVQWRETFGG